MDIQLSLEGKYMIIFEVMGGKVNEGLAYCHDPSEEVILFIPLIALTF